MEAIYQLVFFASLALLAVVMTLYVISVSLLGRAIRFSIDEQTAAEEQRKEVTKEAREKILEKLNEAEQSGEINTRELQSELDKLNGKINRHNWNLRWIKLKPKLLTAMWGAIIPAAVFLTAGIFSALAMYTQETVETANGHMVTALVFIGIGLIIICLILKSIESVAKASDETAFDLSPENSYTMT